MPRLLGNIPWLRKLFGKGVNSDISPEFLPEAFARDAQNMRPSGVLGNSGALESVGGEQALFVPEPDEVIQAQSYICIGVCDVGTSEVSFWASQDPGQPVRVKINGVTMVESGDIPYRWDRPLQFGDVNTVEGGRIYPTDHESDLLFWDIPAIIAAFNAGEQTYFAAFDIAQIAIPTQSQVEWLEHIASPIGNGLPSGQYSYQLRWARNTGDRTNLGPPTPLITIPRVQAPIYSYSGQYPGGQTTGGTQNPDTSIATPYGITLRFQVDNVLGFTIAEIVRTRYNNGLGLNGPGITEVIGRLDIAPGEFDNDRRFTDPVDANFLEVIPIDEAQQEQVNFTAPKTVEHVDKRLVVANFRLRDRIADLAFRLLGGLKVFPITQRVFTRYGDIEYNDGHSDPVNNTYTKSAQHNERYSLGVEIWDDRASRSPVFPMEDNFQFPDKRDRKTGGPLTYSSDPIYAANNECQDPGDGTFDPVSPTFDCIVQGNTPKVDDSYTNVINELTYRPFSPVNVSDEFVRYRQKPVTERVVTQSGVAYGDTGNIFAPQYHTLGVGIPGVLNIPVWARVIGLMRTDRAERVVAEGSGAYDLEEGPGGLYSYNPSGSAATITRRKSINTLRCFFPDIDAAVVSQSTTDDLSNNPQNYRVRLTPYGFYSEPYAYRGKEVGGRIALILAGEPALLNVVPGNFIGLQDGDAVSGTGIPPGTVVVGHVGDTIFLNNAPTLSGTYSFTFYRNAYGQDLISYATMQFEPGDGVANSVNVGDAPGTQGYQPTFSAPSTPTNYIGPGAGRAVPIQGVTDINSGDYSVFLDSATNSVDQGAIDLPLESFEPIVEGRNTIYRLRTSTAFYTWGGAVADAAFNDQLTRRFHEGMYSVQIIRTDAVVPDLNVQQYKVTGSYIDVARCIGFGQEVIPPAFYDLELFHAHRDSCVGYLSTDYRYCYIQEVGQPELRYLCITNNVLAQADFATIQADIQSQGFWVAPDGLPVHGIYQAVTDITSAPRPIHFLRFGEYVGMPTPNVGARIIVKYDDTAVWRCTGFDCSIGPTVFAPYDRSFNAANGYDNGGGNMQVFNGAPLPYNGGGRASQYVLPRDGAQPAASVEPSSFNKAVSLRQWAVWMENVTRIQQRMDAGVDGTGGEQFPFPRTHYVIRPSAFSGYTNGADNGFDPQYDVDYPDEGILNFPLGGFHIRRTYNLDYAKKPIVTGLGLPQNGAYPKTLFPYSYLASLPLDPQQVDTPGLGTFLWDNLFTVSQENGEIKKILSLNGQLFGGCETGLHRVPYNKQMLTDADGQLIGTQSIGNFWPREELWLARGSKGMPDQVWRNATKVNSDGIDTMIWTDRVSFYELRGGQIVDIARNKYLAVLQPVITNMIGEYGQGYSAFYNFKQGEVWISIPVDESLPEHRAGSRVYVYSCVNREWIGQFTYNYDQFLGRETELIGYRSLSANLLDVGDTLNPGFPIPIPCYATAAFFEPVGAYKEMMRWRVVGVVPDEVEVYDHQMNLRCRMSAAENNSPLWVKLYDSYEGWVSRVLASVDSQRPLPQGVGFFVKIKWNSLGRKTISAVDAQTKQIR